MIVDINLTAPFRVAFEQIDKSQLDNSVLLVKLGTDDFPASDEDIIDVDNALYEMQETGLVPKSCLCLVTSHACDIKVQDIPLLATMEEFCKEYKANNVNVSDYIDKFEDLLNEFR